MSSPMPQLRPMTAGDILDTAIRIYRQNFVRLVGIVAIINVPVLLLTVITLLLTNPFTTNFSNFSNPSSFSTFGQSPAALIGYLFQLVIGVFSAVAALFQNAALTVFVSERFLGNAITIREAYRRALKHWLSLLIVALLLLFAYVALFGALGGMIVLPLVGIAALGSQSSAGFSAVMGVLSLCFCALILPALVLAAFLFTRWAFFIQAIVLENYNSTGGLGRSWKLVKGSFWRVLIIIIILAFIVSLLSVGPIELFSITSAALGLIWLAIIGGSVISSIVIILLTPIQYAALTILYYDLRIRKEGFDLQMQLQSTAPASDLPSLIPGAPA